MSGPLFFFVRLKKKKKKKKKKSVEKNAVFRFSIATFTDDADVDSQRNSSSRRIGFPYWPSPFSLFFLFLLPFFFGGRRVPAVPEVVAVVIALVVAVTVTVVAVVAVVAVAVAVAGVVTVVS